MPFADIERQRAAVRDWMKRNPERVKAAKQRYRDKQKRIRAMTRTITRMLEPRWSNATPEQRRHLRKLRRCGVPQDEARRIAYGDV